MSGESVKGFYNRQYSFHAEQRLPCPNALHDLAKAQRRVAGVIRGFGIDNCGPGAAVLDVGSGLGYYTKALAATGANVTGIDFSDVAIDTARATFPDCRFNQASWPEDLASDTKFDVIWMVNFSLMNTFDVDFINDQLIREAALRLKRNGYLVVGWNSDFSGKSVGGYSHWSLQMLRKMRATCGLSYPLVIEAQSKLMSWTMIRAAYLLGRSIPIFMVHRNI